MIKLYDLNVMIQIYETVEGYNSLRISKITLRP